MLCDKADCNYYDSSMEYNCAWGNDGSSSIMCMTHDYKRYCQRPLTSKSGYVEGVNYKKLYEHEKNLHALAEARFRAGEITMESARIYGWGVKSTVAAYNVWQQSIKNYEDYKKEAGR